MVVNAKKTPCRPVKAHRGSSCRSGNCGCIIERMYEQFTGNPPNQQDILNALPARNRPERKRVPVQARIMWENDGEEWKPGHALRLDEQGNAIFVEFLDKRKKFTGVWLHPDDVQWDGKQ